MNDYINASKIWPMCPDPGLSVVRVKNGVANITNRKVLIRMSVPQGTPNGLYNIGMYGELKQIVHNNVWDYPDVDLLEPDFNALKTPCHLLPQVREHLIMFCRNAFAHGCNIVIERDRVTAQHLEGLYLHPFNLNNSITINARYLEIVLVTFKAHHVLYLARENKENSPLIVGIDWGTSALIMPERRGYGSNV